MDPLTSAARSWLFVPATRPDRFAKAAASGADSVIVDLEDAVSPGEKRDARRHLLRAPWPEGVPLYLRVNGCGTEWFEEDLAVAAALPLAGILLPKADSQEQGARAAAALPERQRVVPIVETALGLWNVLEVARAPKVERLAFGALDFELDTGMRDEAEALAYARSRIVVASKVAGIAPPLDAVSPAVDDEARLRADAERARRFGFAGKLCIHPKQVGPTNRAFQPSDEEVEWARALSEAAAARPPEDRGAFSFRGAMIDRPVMERARQILARASVGKGEAHTLR
jgi:citrate lyase subunit beta / citryl-CoA lyase